MKKALFLLDSVDRIYDESTRESLARLVDFCGPPADATTLKSAPERLRDAAILFGGWGTPTMDETFLALAPHLEAVFYAAGSIRGIVTDAFWRRGITICSAWAANAAPVAEYTAAQIVLALKKAHQGALLYRQHRSTEKARTEAHIMGVYGSTVGIISLGMIGKMVAEKLKCLDVAVCAYDPFTAPEEAEQLGVALVSLEDVFARADVVSLHTPWLPETEGMITARHFAAMKPHATFINTARGAVVRESEMLDVLEARPDLFAVLDVTHPEPPELASRLWDLPNIMLTPHLAGSCGQECHRMGHFMLEEVRRYLNHQPLQWQVTEPMSRVMA